MSRISGGYGDGPGVDSEELVKEVLQKSGWSVKELRKIHEGNNGIILRQRVLDMSAVSQVTDVDAFGTSDPMVFFRRDDFEVVTDNVSQFSAGFGQGGIAKSDVDLSPFGHEDGGQAGLGDFGGVGR